MGIIKKTNETNSIQIDDKLKESLIQSINEQDALLSSLGFLNVEFEDNKKEIIKKIKKQDKNMENMYNDLKAKYGEGKIDIENWTYKINKGE